MRITPSHIIIESHRDAQRVLRFYHRRLMHFRSMANGTTNSRLWSHYMRQCKRVKARLADAIRQTEALLAGTTNTGGDWLDRAIRERRTIANTRRAAAKIDCRTIGKAEWHPRGGWWLSVTDASDADAVGRMADWLAAVDYPGRIA